MRRGVRLLRLVCHALPILALAVSVAPAFAQSSLVCQPIRRGESAAQAARRVAGDSRKMYSTSFQIVNGASKVVPKSHYDRRLRAGWRACVARPPARSTALRRADPPAALDTADPSVPAATPVVETPLVAATAPVARLRVTAQPAVSAAPRRIGNLGVDLTIVWVATAIAVPWVGTQIVHGYVTRRRLASVRVQQFAARFIAEFERPLIRYDDRKSPLRAQVRRVRRQRFDILLAPGEGRRYPNLTDHKRNVEYDVGRVLSALDDAAFVAGDPFTQAEWVVVPFHLRTSPRQSGVTCTSSS
jgi:hypothetical protein